MESTVKFPDEKSGDSRWDIAFMASSINLNGGEIRFEDNIAMQFEGRNEFAHDRNLAHFSWSVLRRLTLNAKNDNKDLFILCSKDHHFSGNYTADYLREGIDAAERKEADMLLGAVNWFESAIQIDSHLFWLDKFSGLQFIIFFSRCYDALLSMTEEQGVAPEQLLSSMTATKLLLYPFVSCVTEKVAKPNAVSEDNLFYGDPADQLALLLHVRDYYSTNND